MTNTFLNISNMKSGYSIGKVESILEEAVYQPDVVFQGRAKISGSALRYEDIKRKKNV